MLSNPNPLPVSRRRFLKATASVTLGSVAAGPGLAAVLANQGAIALVVTPDDPLATAVPPAWALGELRTALEAQGATVRVVPRLADADAREFCVIVSGMTSPL